MSSTTRCIRVALRSIVSSSVRCSSALGSTRGSSSSPTLVRTAVSGVRSSWAIVDSNSVRIASISASNSTDPGCAANDIASIRLPSGVTWYRVPVSVGTARVSPRSESSSRRALAVSGLTEASLAPNRSARSWGSMPSPTSASAAPASGDGLGLDGIAEPAYAGGDDHDDRPLDALVGVPSVSPTGFTNPPTSRQ